MRTLIVCLFFLCSLAGKVSGQSLFLRKHSLPVKYINASIGLIYQDKSNYIWLATDSGLFRFDGFDCIHYPVPSGEKVTALYDNGNELWAGTENGSLACLNGKKFRPLKSFPSPIKDLSGSNRSLFVATYGSGLFQMNLEDDSSATAIKELPDDFITDILPVKETLYIATENGLALLTPDGILNLSSKDGLKDKFITALCESENGDVLYATQGGNTGRIQKSGTGLSLLEGSNSPAGIRQLFHANSSTWFISEEGLMSAEEKGQRASLVTFLRHDPGRRISSILLDNEGILWISNGSSDFFSASTGLRIYSDATLSGKTVQALLGEDQNSFWYSTSDDLFYTGNDNHMITACEKLNRENVNVISMYMDDHSAIWIGTYGQGLYQVDKDGSIRKFSTRDGLLSDNIFSIDGRGDTLWIACIGGASIFKITKDMQYLVTSYSGKNGPGSNYLYKVLVDTKGRVWFGTDGAGITCYENGQFRSIGDHDNRLKGSNVYSITEDEGGNIWFTVEDAGVFKMDTKGKLQAFSTDEGLRDNTISSIIADKKGCIIMTSRHGIDQLNISTGNVFYHSEELGISEFDPDINAYWEQKNGNIWIGGKEKILNYKPDTKHKPEWPLTHITGVSVFLNDTTGITTLSYENNHITFSYIGLWFHDPSEVVYQVMLEGYDTEWVTSKNRSVTYPRLDPGKYVFKVRSSATGNFEGAQIISYPFTITPPFYKTTWFALLITALLVFIIYAGTKWRIRNIRRAEEMKNRKIALEFETLKSQVNPHFLFNSFNTLTAIIEQDKKTAVEYVEKLSDFFRNVLLHKDDNLISVPEELKQLELYVFLQKKRYRDNLKVNIDPELLTSGSMIAPLTLQLLVENAVKHNIISKQKPLMVTISGSDDSIVVRNNLQKKLTPEPSTGTGLKNIVNRYSLLTGEPVQIEETATHYTVKIPLLK